MEKAINKKDYLKKYLSGGDKKKRKKKVTSSTSSKSKIIDDDLDLKNMRPLDENELEIYDLAEDAPQIAGIVDERPEEVRVMSQYRETKKWKIVTREYEDVKVSAVGGSDSDQTPSRKDSRKAEKKRSSKRKAGSSSDSDVSVERRKNVDSDASPPRKMVQKHTPRERKRTKSNDDSDASPPRKSHRKKQKSGSDTDVSPPRRRKPDSDSDASPKRRKKHERHHESIRNERSDTRVSVNKHRHEDSFRREERSGRAHREERKESRDRERSEKVVKTLEGKNAGLHNAADMKKEAAEIRRRQADSLAQLGDEVSGRGATAVLRDKKTGKRRDMKEEARQKREKDEKNAEILAKYAVWGKGMKQVDERAVKMREELHEMAKPVARYADDEDLEEMRRNEEREGDPMLEYMRSKRKKEGGGGKAKPQYQGSYMPNRYNIKPGYRWDGVDRSSGYEKKWFEERNARKAREEEAFKWSTEDM